jgi:sugar phosphate permease
MAALFCLGCAIPIPFLDNFVIIAALLWFLLFFGGAILPAMTGMMLNTVNGAQKTTANSLANLSYNLLGYLPAPFVYGAIYDSGDGGNSRQAMATLMFSPIISASTLMGAVYLITRDNILNYKE